MDSEEWRDGAKCRDLSMDSFKQTLPPHWHRVRAWADEQRSGTELFYPPRDKRLYKPIADYAKAVCNGRDGRPPCAVRVECLLYALRREEANGIFGGMSHRERNAFLRKWRMRSPSVNIRGDVEDLRSQAQRLIDARGK